MDFDSSLLYPGKVNGGVTVGRLKTAQSGQAPGRPLAASQICWKDDELNPDWLFRSTASSLDPSRYICFYQTRNFNTWPIPLSQIKVFAHLFFTTWYGWETDSGYLHVCSLGIRHNSCPENRHSPYSILLGLADCETGSVHPSCYIVRISQSQFWVLVWCRTLSLTVLWSCRL